jgi:hypothetical protein
MTLDPPPNLAELEAVAQEPLEGEAAWRDQVLTQFRNRCDELELRPAANWWAAIRFYLNLVDARALMDKPQASYRTDLFELFLRQNRRQITYEHFVHCFARLYKGNAGVSAGRRAKRALAGKISRARRDAGNRRTALTGVAAESRAV